MAGASKRITEVIDLSADMGGQVARRKNILFHLFEHRETNRGFIAQVILFIEARSPILPSVITKTIVPSAVRSGYHVILR